ncbi:ATP-binding protein [Burkholderia pseudomallei]|uniref:ATP-binding protein n=1 Tax=Burkholderia pseudomallei TaxID=28450 RepID=UPI000531DCDC|nr:ATP-binding protein [Burkholderia pseudomallei]KGS99265.1 AAA domain protein [Burkholderia pseudomallei]KGV13986.1 AAA domain protein [Burkholderia pseudomallei MSHR4300]KGV45091.1 AAA domain protein [Burkholderia pseudomallei MSHR4012]KGV49600.1 AAA domain protein [Burkholderia pseudomallei MSHR4003]KGW12191.1 AAA domain protein [Burkholderia pseudomallei MSHR4000]
MTLFVGGIHAVGKTFVLKPVCEELGIRHATASQLIQEQRGLTNWTVSRQVDDIDANQRALVSAVRRLEEGGETVVLDGHFVLRRGVNVHEKIGVETFAQLTVRGVILLETSCEIVADRLRGRGDATWEQSEIEIFAQKELEHAQTVCAELGVPLLRLCSPSMLKVRDALALLGA